MPQFKPEAQVYRVRIDVDVVALDRQGAVDGAIGAWQNGGDVGESVVVDGAHGDRRSAVVGTGERLMPTTSILALLDTLDGLHGQATPVVDGGIDRGDGYLVPADNDIRDYLWFKAGEATTPEDMEFVMALAVAYPRLAQALRAALTPTTDGEREAREALAAFDLPRCGRLLDWVIQGLRCNDVEGHAGSCSHDSRCDVRERATVVTPEHLRTALALLATERAKAAAPDLLVAAEGLLDRLDIHENNAADSDYCNAEAVYQAKTALRTAIARARGKVTP